MTAAMPALFVSHGSPMLLLETETSTYAFLAGLGRRLPRPRAIVAVSAHWCTTTPMVSAASAPATIHDFYGFPDELYRRRYTPPGSPETAARVAALLQAGGMAAGVHPSRGLDHGAWAPLSLMWPEADVPVLQLSVQPNESAAHHLEMGRLLRPLLEEGVLVLGSGSATHNLGAIEWGDFHAPPPDWSRSFADWLTARVEAGDSAALSDWLKTAPLPRRSHPTDEHYLPLLTAMGAAGQGAHGVCLHDDYNYGSLAMHAYRFDPAPLAA